MTSLIYVHGSGHTHESFDAQVAAFAGSDAVSLPGHPEGLALTSIGDCAVWLAKYLHWKGDGRAIVMGNSLGGAIALEWALRYPADVAGLILVGTGARLKVAPEIFSMIESDWPECIDTIVGWELSPAAPADLRKRVVEWHVRVGQASTRQDFTLCNGFDVMEKVAAIYAPTLVIVGEHDRMTPLKYSQFLTGKIAGSDLAVIEGAGHMAHLERPDVVNDHIRRKFGEVIG